LTIAKNMKLYNKGALSSKDSKYFDNMNRDEDGEGPIDGTVDSEGWYCAKLAGTDLFGEEEYLLQADQ